MNIVCRITKCSIREKCATPKCRTLARVTDITVVSGLRPEVWQTSRVHKVLLFTTQCCLCNRVAACPMYPTIFKPEIWHQLNSLSLSKGCQKPNILSRFFFLLGVHYILFLISMPCSFVQERLSGGNDCTIAECVVAIRCFLSGGFTYCRSWHFRAVWNGRNLHDKAASYFCSHQNKVSTYL